MLDQILNESESVKHCAYPNCENTILATSEFEYCEVCRALSLRNSFAILLDPSAPISDRRDMIFHSALHNMRPDEILNAVHKIEWIYLELKKQIHSAKLEEHRRTKFDEAIALVAEERNKPKAPKAQKRRETAIDKKKKGLLDLCGGDESKMRQILGEDIDVSDL